MADTIYFIVNARIGEQKIESLKQSVALYLKQRPVEIHITTYGGHGRLLAKEAIQKGCRILVAVGGDGTVNEVIQEVAKTTITLAIIPTGSGNGLARHCSIPLTIEDAVKLISEGKAVTIDLGKANGVYFISNAGVGFDAWVCNTIKQTKSRGLKMYIRQVIRNYFSYISDTYVIETDGKTMTKKAFFLNVANGKEFGYGFQIAPKATLQDGYLVMILVEKINILNGLSFVIDGWRKRLIYNKHCLYIRAKKITIKGNRLQYFQTDGDAHDCDGNCLIEVIPNALKMLVPKHINDL